MRQKSNKGGDFCSLSFVHFIDSAGCLAVPLLFRIACILLVELYDNIFFLTAIATESRLALSIFPFGKLSITYSFRACNMHRQPAGQVSTVGTRIMLDRSVNKTKTVI